MADDNAGFAKIRAFLLPFSFSEISGAVGSTVAGYDCIQSKREDS